MQRSIFSQRRYVSSQMEIRTYKISCFHLPVEIEHQLGSLPWTTSLANNSNNTCLTFTCQQSKVLLSPPHPEISNSTQKFPFTLGTTMLHRLKCGSLGSNHILFLLLVILRNMFGITHATTSFLSRLGQRMN